MSAATPSVDRVALRSALRARYPWLAAVDVGPASVEAGECDRCGAEARMVQPCGPLPAGAGTWPGRLGPDWALGRSCAAELGVEVWCDGHEAEAQEALAWLAALPAEADDVARLWWVATGEVRLDPELVLARRRALLGA